MTKLFLLKLFVVLATTLSMSGNSALGQTAWSVPGDGSNSCTPANPSCNTIQEAVDAASSGDAIGIVGLYVENVIIEKNLILLGAGTDNTIVGGTQSGEPVFKITGATVTLAEMTITDGDGGGISSSSATVPIENSPIGSNMSDGGGGIFNDSGTMTITNSTINGNSAGSSGVGGGITNDGGTMAIEFSTISGNTASEGGGIPHVGVLVELSNSIVANNPSGGDCAGNITSQGYNIDSDNSCSLTAVGDLPNTNPLLGTLQNNGGPTETQALLTGTPAINAGNPIVLL